MDSAVCLLGSGFVEWAFGVVPESQRCFGAGGKADDGLL